MKIVINVCFGGFSLSPLAVRRLAELQGKECYFFDYDVSSRVHAPVKMEELSGSFWQAFSVPNPDEAIAYKGQDWHAMTDEEKTACNARYQAINLNKRGPDRTDPLLIQVVEELGEAADGSCADLKIVEIPDGIEWVIDEYDGMESIHEKHRSWS